MIYRTGAERPSAALIACELASYPPPAERIESIQKPALIARLNPLEFLLAGVIYGISRPLLTFALSDIAQYDEGQADIVARFVAFCGLGFYVSASLLRAASVGELGIRKPWLPCGVTGLGVLIGSVLSLSERGLIEVHSTRLLSAATTAGLVGGTAIVFAFFAARTSLTDPTSNDRGSPRHGALLVAGTTLLLLAAETGHWVHT